MKINILGQYRDVSRLLQLPSQPTPSATEFRAVLSGESLKAKANQITTLVAPQESTALLTPSEDAHASLRLREPSLLSPEPIRLSPPKVSEPIPVKSPEPSVKTPTLVEAMRTTFPNPFVGMTQEQTESTVASLVSSAGVKHGVDPALSMAVISVESSFKPNAISADGHFSKGLMQLLDSTGKEELGKVSAAAAYQPFNPHLNVELGVRYLRKLHDLFSAATEVAPGLKTTAAANSASLEKLAVAAYNAGQGRVASAQQRAQRDGKDSAEYSVVEPYLPQSTQEYVQKVLGSRSQYEERFGS